jgi:broad specificity phosphatase PhoE
MSTLYLIRHGQAGTRTNYDALSDLGRTQARLLGEYFSAQGIQFQTTYSGTLARQQATVQHVREAASSAIGEILFDPGWDEFDLTQVLDEFSPWLAAEDEAFRREHEAITSALAAVAAWIEGRYEFSGESWKAFSTRIHAAFDRVSVAHASRNPPSNIAVFTSATPIALCAALSLEIPDARTMQLAGVMLNTAISTLRLRSDGPRLFTFNAVPHLELVRDAALRTFR